MSLRIKFKNWITLSIILPGALLLIVVNVGFWLSLQTRHQQSLEGLNERHFAELDGILTSERVRLRSIASLPITLSLVQSVERRNRGIPIARRNEQNQSVEESWSSLERGNLQVRNVLDNTVAELFAHLSQSRARSSNLLLTDAAGAVLASSRRTQTYDFSQTSWWQEAREQKKLDQIVAHGIGLDGTIRLSYGIWAEYETPVLLGILNETLSLGDFDLLGKTNATHQAATLLMGTDATWLLHGNSETAAEATSMIEGIAPAQWSSYGYREGHRYAAARVDAGLMWTDPLWILTVQPEARFPPAIYVPLMFSCLTSFCALFLFSFASIRSGKAMFFDPMHELVEAGLWVTDKASERLQIARPGVPSELREDLQLGESTPSRTMRDLDEWMHTLKQEMHDTIYAQTYEMQKDIELARDFQMAYLDRPYPNIPSNHIEGRLRLKFSHRYEPALALGGDFFNIVRLSDDCAGIFIADVMGHGTRSALITAILRTLISDLIQQGRNARHFISEINKQFCTLISGIPSPQFASCFYFVADVTGRVGTYTTAGHPAPFLLRRSVGRIQRLNTPDPGAALGLLSEEEYTGGHTRLQDGDIFLFYTDGFYEATNEANEEFGFQRMEQVMKSLLYKSCDEVLDGMMSAVRDFAGEEPVADDICLIAVEVTTRPKDS